MMINPQNFVIKKSLALMDDLQLGVGKTEQCRSGKQVAGYPVHAFAPVSAEVDLRTLDPKYMLAVVKTDTVLTYYAYSVNSTGGVKSDVAIGSWIRVSIGNSEDSAYTKLFSFDRGNTLDYATDALYNEQDGGWYIWQGQLPKIVPPKSTIASTGGLGPTAWKRVTIGSLAADMDEATGPDAVLALGRTKYTRYGSFANGSVINSHRQALLHKGKYYAYKKTDFPKVVPANSVPDSDWISVGLATMFVGQHNLYDFGCVSDNGITDNRVGIQEAVEYMEFCNSQLHTDSMSPTEYFGVSSFHPMYPAKHCVVLTRPRAIDIYGGRIRNSSIYYTGQEQGESLFEVVAGASDWGMIVNSLGLNAGSRLSYAFKGVDVWYANSMFTGGCYENALVDGLRISSYMTSFLRVYSTTNGEAGITFCGPLSEGGATRGTATSLAVIDCWSRDAGAIGFRCINELWYSHFTCTGVDGLNADKRVPLAYYFANVKGVVMTAIGAEQCVKLLKVDSYHSFELNGFQLSGVGPKTGTTDYLIEFVRGFHAKVGGMAPIGTEAENKFTYLVAVTNPGGNDRIVFTDTSIRSTKVAAIDPTPGSYKNYPEIFYWSAGRSQDRGLPRTSNIVHVEKKDYSISVPTIDSIISKDLIVRTTGPGEIRLFDTPDSRNFTVVVEVVAVAMQANGTAIADFSGTSQLLVTKRNLSAARKMLVTGGSGWSITGTNSVSLTITEAAALSWEFIVNIRYTSTDTSGIVFRV